MIMRGCESVKRGIIMRGIEEGGAAGSLPYISHAGYVIQTLFI